MDEKKIMFERLTAGHLPFLYDIRFSVEENFIHPHQIQYLQRKQATEDIEQGHGFICKVGAEYAGFCFGVFIPEAIIGGMFVKPEFQSIGIGTTLLKYVTDSMFKHGANEILLTTDAKSRAVSFYEKNGWNIIGTDEYGQLELKRINE